MSDEQTQPSFVEQAVVTMADVGGAIAAPADPTATFAAVVSATSLLIRAVNEIKRVGRGLSPEMESVLADAEKFLGQ